MSKEAYYFSHDANARQDEKILMLRAEHGWEGYGIYWALVEMMFESSDTSLSLHKLKGISFSYNIDITLLNDVINTCIIETLFASDGEVFWSESLRKRKAKYKDAKQKKSEAGKKGMAKRWAQQGSDNTVITKDNTVITEDNKGKEIKEIKESKLNKVNDIKPPQKEESEKPKPVVVDEKMSVIDFYEKNGFGAITPHVGNKVFAWVDDLNEPLVIHAMKIAIENNALRWSYVESILKDWDKQKMRTVEQVEAVELQRKAQQTPFKGRAVKDEKAPGWLAQQKANRAAGIVEQDEVTEDYEEQKRALLKKLGVKEGVQ